MQTEKDTKREARYVDRYPVEEDRCRHCTMFRPPHGCTSVQGTISQDGHCKYFEAKDE